MPLGEWIHRFFGLLLIAVMIGFIALQFTPGGDDYGVYCAASDAFRTGEDPYDFSVLLQHGTIMPYHYPPLFLPVFGVLCHLPGIPVRLTEYILFTGALVGTILIFSRMKLSQGSLSYSVVLLFTAFLGISWSYTTGNIGGIIFLFFLVLVYYSLERRRYLYSSLLLGMMASVTIFPLLFSPLLLCIEDKRIDRRTILLPAFGVVGGVFLLSWMTYPSLFFSYLGRILGSNNPLISEQGGFFKPTLYAVIGDMQTFLIGENAIAFAAILMIIFLLAILLFVHGWRGYQGSLVDMFSWGVLWIFLFLPHLKPYYFTLAILPTCVLFRNATDRIKSASLVVVALFPMISTLMYRQSFIPSPLLNLILSYNQILAVLLTLILLTWLNERVKNSLALGLREVDNEESR
jgi:hypothetical protein